MGYKNLTKLYKKALGTIELCTEEKIEVHKALKTTHNQML